MTATVTLGSSSRLVLVYVSSRCEFKGHWLAARCQVKMLCFMRHTGIFLFNRGRWGDGHVRESAEGNINEMRWSSVMELSFIVVMVSWKWMELKFDGLLDISWILYFLFIYFLYFYIQQEWNWTFWNNWQISMNRNEKMQNGIKIFGIVSIWLEMELSIWILSFMD